MTKATTLDDLASTLDDVAESIVDMSTMMAAEFASVRSEMVDLYAATKEDTREVVTESEVRILAKADNGFATVYKEVNYGFAQNTIEHKELGDRFDTQEDLLLAVHADIKELYSRIDKLRTDTKHMSTSERQRLAELEAFAMQVAERTGIPFNLKSKRRS